MDPITLMLLSQLIPTGVNLIKSASQAHKANQLDKTARPQYNIPDAVTQMVQSARNQAGQTQLPGQALMEQKLASNTANGIADLKNVSNNPNDLASNVARLYQGQQGQQNNLNIAAAQNWNANQGVLRQALGTLGQYQDKAWQLNKFDPYRNAKAAEAALKEGAFRNLSSAGQNVASGIGGYANMLYNKQLLDSLINPGATQGFAANMYDTGKSLPGVNVNVRQNMGTGLPSAINGASPEVPQGPDNYNEMMNSLIGDYLNPETWNQSAPEGWNQSGDQGSDQGLSDDQLQKLLSRSLNLYTPDNQF